MIENKKKTKSPPKIMKLSDGEKYDELNEHKILISSAGKFQKSLSSNEINFNSMIAGCDKCEKCILIRENLNKAINHVRSYVDTINEKLNLVYYKTGSIKKPAINIDVETSLCPEVLYTGLYSDLEKLKVGGELINQLRFLMKSVRLFQDKFEYIFSKHENFEKMLQDYKNYLLSNKIEEISKLTEVEINEVKALNEQSIFQNFNIARENFENTLKELKNGLNVNEKISNMVDNKQLETSLEINYENSKETYLKNELSRMLKENTSLRLEINYICEKLREENKIYEIKEDVIVRRLNSSSKELNSDSSQNNKLRKLKTSNYSSGFSSAASSNNLNSLITFKVKNNKVDEDYLIAKNYIKRLKQSEFYMI